MKITFELETLKRITMFAEEYRKICDKYGMRLNESVSSGVLRLQAESAFGMITLCEIDLLDDDLTVIGFDLTNGTC